MKRLIAFALVCTSLLTGLLEDITGIDWAKAFASPAPAASSSGSIEALKEASAPIQSFQTDLFTGRAQLSVPIFTPPGRRGLTPQVALGYSSSSGNSWIGIGWNMDEGFIQRSTRKGVPTYNDAQDTFTFSIHGVASDLVQISANEYRAKDETGEFLRFIYQGNFWTVLDKSGAEYHFGENEQAKQRNAHGIFSWALEKVKDVLGNTINYTYTADGGGLYLQTIDYNGNETENFSPTHSVQFILENRPDTVIAYNTGSRVEITKRLKEVDVNVQGLLSRKYTLQYDQSSVIGRSRLTQVRECGTDGVTCLPPQTFTYQNGGATFSTTPVTWQIPNPEGTADFRNLNTGQSGYEEAGLYDLNGDGLPDRVIGRDTYTDGWKVYYNTGAGFSQNPVLWPVQDLGYSYFRRIQCASAEGTNVTLFDFNRDGFLDRLVTNPSVSGDPLHVFYDVNGTGFSSQDSPVSNMPVFGLYFYLQEHVQGNGNTQSDFMDLNGDGLTERVLRDTSSNQWKLYQHANGSFNTTPTLWSVPNPDGDDSFRNLWTGADWAQEAGLFDINGDGLPDRIIAKADSQDWKVYYNNGSGFESTPEIWTLPTPPATVGLTNFRKLQVWGAEGTSTTLIDINGDGLPDHLSVDPNSNNPADYKGILIYLNTGHGFATQPIIYSNAPSDGLYAYITEHNQGNGNVQSEFIDLDGDGLVERVVRDANNDQWFLYKNTGNVPDLLKTVSNGRGSITNLEYTPSTKFDNRDTNGIYRLPFSTQLVTKTTTTDGMGNSYVTNYGYKGGMYDVASREFWGFRETTVTDARGTQTIHTFGQDDHLKGKTLKTEVKDSSGNLFSKQENTWSDTHPFPGVHFSFLSQSDSYLYDGDSTFKQTRKRFEYDGANGNVLKVYEDGDPNITTDDKRVENQYVTNDTANIFNTISKVSVYNNLNALISEKYFYYDAHANLTDVPDKGLLTKQEDLVSTGIKTKVEMTYDLFGNVKTIKDALNRVTTNDYDTTFNLYLVKVTNALNQTQEFTYDPLIAQITQTKDQNAQISKTIYDPLGRAVKTVSPLDSEASPAQAVYYDDATFPNRVITHIKTDSAAPALTVDDETHTGYLTAYSFVDGLGREIEKRSPAEDSGNQIVSKIVTFDTRGQAHEQYAPYLSSKQKYYTPDYAGVPKATFTYDAVGRRTRVDFPDATFSTIQFDDYVKTVTDANGHLKRYTQDAFGNLIKVEEFNQGSTYTTQYQYDSSNRLIKTIDHLNHQATVSYDLLGRKTGMTDPDMGHWVYAYDLNGNLLTQQDAKNQTMTFTYDELNRLTRKTYPNNTHIDYTYDACDPATCGGLSGENYPIGKLLKVVDASGVQTFRYDKLGRVIQDKKSLDDGHDYGFTRAYDGLGRVIGLQYPDNEILGIVYNNMGEAEIIYSQDTLGATQTIISSVDYNASGQITKIIYGNGVVSDYTYNPQTLRLQNLVTKDSAQVSIQNLSYQFDNVGNVNSITDTINTNTQSFIYDNLDRLTQATGTYGLQTYVYDAIGNMTQKESAALTYGSASHPHAVTHFQTYNQSIDYQYDANGNMTGRTFSASSYDALNYDYDNRLTNIIHHEIEDNGGCHGSTDHQTQTAAFTYDASGARVKKVAGTNTTYYLGKDYEVEYGTSSLTRKAFFLGDTRIAEKEISSGGVVHFRWFHGDHLGSTNVVTNETGVRSLLMEYTPYGEVKIRAGSDVVKNTFTGQKEDNESGLMYYNARYYDAKLGRFISADSIVPDPTNPQDLNRYSYVNNNPIRFTDPSGHKKKHSWWKVFLGIVIVAAAIFVGAVAGFLVQASFVGLGHAAVSGVGATIGAIAGGAAGGVGAASLNGGNAGAGALGGALTGGIAGGGNLVSVAAAGVDSGLATGQVTKASEFVKVGAQMLGDFGLTEKALAQMGSVFSNTTIKIEAFVGNQAVQGIIGIITGIGEIGGGIIATATGHPALVALGTVGILKGVGDAVSGLGTLLQSFTDKNPDFKLSGSILNNTARALKVNQSVLDAIDIGELAQGLKSSRSVGAFERITRFGDGISATDSTFTSYRRIKRSLQP